MASDSPSSARKVVVHLRATGDAPILKQAKFKIPGTDKFAKVIEFLRRQLHRDTLVDDFSTVVSLNFLMGSIDAHLNLFFSLGSLYMSTVHSHQTQMNW
ncbi:hypothetical protein PVL29_011183 [Vitis rotundifolia]|uniref:Ubiquitin-like protein ATG12 n=1 Tax=Vitis rotundifolia TaxID=103349 RepID=A0AA38ZN12_VITRO|nr:hypothetical protein PVL29_011183 [Vitis rotundifolia]